ncbi:unnamed protein product [Pedinophyceae sp. YPF-701]|nr:unnamed protein product [Pedinophyceae sp. YPF-701]
MQRTARVTPQGSARTLVRARAAMGQAGAPTLYTHVLCPYAHRAWLAMLEKGIDFNMRHVDLSNKPADLLRVNPRGLVPAVEHDGSVVVESADIVQWVDDTFAGPPLTPEDAAAAAAMRDLIDGPLGRVQSAGFSLMAGSTGRYWGIGSGQTSAHWESFVASLKPLADSLERHGGPFLVGAHPTVADILVYPFLERFDVAAQGMMGFDVRADDVHGGAVGRWMDAMAARPSSGVASPDRALLLRAFERHKSLDFFDYEAYGEFDLHPHNKRA